MAKRNKGSPNTSKSLLAAAWQAFERGDNVRARAIATRVASGERGEGEDEMARILSTRLEDPAVDPIAVARAIVCRTRPPPKVYLIALVVVLVQALLLLFVASAYSHRGV